MRHQIAFRLAGLLAAALGGVACATAGAPPVPVGPIRREEEDSTPPLPNPDLFRRLTPTVVDRVLQETGLQTRTTGFPDFRGVAALDGPDSSSKPDGFIDHRDSFFEVTPDRSSPVGFRENRFGNDKKMDLLAAVCGATNPQKTRFTESEAAYRIRKSAGAEIKYGEGGHYESLHFAGVDVDSSGSYEQGLKGCYDNRFGVHFESAREIDPSRLPAEVLAIYEDAKGWGGVYLNLATGRAETANIEAARLKQIYLARREYQPGEAAESLLSPIQGPSSQVMPAIVRADAGFGIDLFRRVAEGATGSNIFISPYSVAAALSMLYQGARGTTRDEMARALRLNGVSPEQIQAGNRALMGYLRSRDPKTVFRVANGVWTRDGMTLAPDYRRAIQEGYEGQIGNLGPDAIGDINRWIGERTDGMIPKMIDSIDPGTLMILANAIYFKGEWSDRFNAVGDQPFVTDQGQSVQVPMMAKSAKFGHLQTDSFDAVRIPYGDDKLSMVILLPHRSSNLEELRGSITPDSWGMFMRGLRETEQGLVTMPKFKAGFRITLNDVLKSMGIRDAFQEGADFSGIAPGVRQHLSQVLHEAVVDVDEIGTRAAAATVVMMRGMGGPFRMTIDRPFFFAVVDNDTALPIFMGEIKNPVQSQ